MLKIMENYFQGDLFECKRDIFDDVDVSFGLVCFRFRLYGFKIYRKFCLRKIRNFFFNYH